MTQAPLTGIEAANVKLIDPALLTRRELIELIDEYTKQVQACDILITHWEHEEPVTIMSVSVDRMREFKTDALKRLKELVDEQTARVRQANR